MNENPPQEHHHNANPKLLPHALTSLSSELKQLRSTRQTLSVTKFNTTNDRQIALHAADRDTTGLLQLILETITEYTLDKTITHDEALQFLKANDIPCTAEPAAEYQALLDTLTPGRALTLHPATISEVPAEVTVVAPASLLLMHDRDKQQSATADYMRAAFSLSVLPLNDPDQEPEYTLFYPRRSSKTNEMTVPGVMFDHRNTLCD